MLREITLNKMNNWNYLYASVYYSVENAVYISVQNSVEDYFQTNSDIIKQ